ncbi:MAG: hypothetical protein WCK65_08640 [Rhodospirillaceae bacterium]
MSATSSALQAASSYGSLAAAHIVVGADPQNNRERLLIDRSRSESKAAAHPPSGHVNSNRGNKLNITV